MLHMFATRVLNTLWGKGKIKTNGVLWNYEEYKGFIDSSMYSNLEDFKIWFAGKVTKVLGSGAN